MRSALVAAGAAAVVVGMLLPGELAIGDERKPENELADAKAATVKYRDVAQAVADGFEPLGGCIGDETGAAGFHYVNLDYVFDREINPTKPEILLYIPDASTGELELVGLEYFKRDLDQELDTDDDRPVLFGEPFVGPIVGRTADQPIHYELHVWMWKHNPRGFYGQKNPDGTVEHFNPELRC